ncbi:MAG: 5'-methylthioadenosine/adenosylhomocysteine nucleosidase, partial [Flavobacteriia bacterium]
MIGIISAMHEEIDALLSAIEITATTEKGQRKYYRGKLFNTDVVLVFSRWGKTASATTVTQMINDYKLSEVIFTGVAGSIINNINIGDIIVGKHLYQHDMDASPHLPQFEIPLLERSFFETHYKNRLKLKKAAGNFIADYHSFITPEEKEEFNIENPQVVISDIASGDQFINKNEQFDHIRKLLPSVGCVEMEGAAVAQVCFEYQMP